MRKAYFIARLIKKFHTNESSIQVMGKQPEDGFSSEALAEEHLQNLLNEGGDGVYGNKNEVFTILPLYKTL